jgi:hypothetical protein
MSASPCLPAPTQASAIVAPSRHLYAPPATSARCHGWKDITARLEAVVRQYAGNESAEVSAGTAMNYAKLPCDPLPVRSFRGQAWCRSHRLDEWLARRNDGLLPNGTKLFVVRGWADILDALGDASYRSAIRWSSGEADPMPIFGRGKVGGDGSVWIYATALRDWMDRHDLPIQAIYGQVDVRSKSEHAPGRAAAGRLNVGAAAVPPDADAFS